MYTGLQHPREFLRGVSTGDVPSHCAVINGFDIPFNTRVTRHIYRRWTDKKPVTKTATRFFATHLDADVLQIRSMGTSYHSNKSRGSVAAILKFAFQTLQSGHVEAFNGAGKITLVMAKIPGQFAEAGLPCFGVPVHPIPTMDLVSDIGDRYPPLTGRGSSAAPRFACTTPGRLQSRHRACSARWTHISRRANNHARSFLRSQ